LNSSNVSPVASAADHVDQLAAAAVPAALVLVLVATLLSHQFFYFNSD